MFRPSGETLALSESQHERAMALGQKISNGEVQSPNDVIDVWEAPQNSINWDRKDNLFPQYEGFIPPSKIRGTTESNITRLKTGRLSEVLAYMIEGKYQIQTTCPPVLRKQGDHLYVTTDGIHRSMAAKAIGLEELYVQYEEVPSHLLE